MCQLDNPQWQYVLVKRAQLLKNRRIVGNLVFSEIDSQAKSEKPRTNGWTVNNYLTNREIHDFFASTTIIYKLQ